jgi:drug/metabolite transporter (DMT)-like permease
LPSPDSLTGPVFLAVLVAAALHAGWNATLKVKLEPFLAMALITVLGGVLAAPLVLWLGWPRAEAWPWLIASMILHMGYYFGLISAYARADMAQVYPLARGGGPLLTAGLSLALLTEPIRPLGLVGICVLGCGILLMAFRGGRQSASPDLPTLGFAGFTAVTIAGYTLADGIGARAAGDPHAYSAALFFIDGVMFGLFALWRRGLPGLRPALGFLPQGFAGAAMSLAAYWIAIWAMTKAPIALVAALRESSVLWAMLISVVVLKEPLTRFRLTAAALIVAGLVLMRVQ